MSRVPTFAGWERSVDGERGYVPPSAACEECGGPDQEHERWCSRGAHQRREGGLVIALKADGSGDWSPR